MNLGNIVDWIKLTPKYIAPIALLSSLLLFLPSNSISIFGVNNLVDTYRMWIGLTCLSSYSLLLTHFVFWLKDYGANARKNYHIKTKRISLLKNLSPEEKEILSGYILTQSKSRQLNMRCGTTNGLEHSMIIYRSAVIGTADGWFAYNLHPWAWDLLSKNPEFLNPIFSQHKEKLR